MDLRAIGISLRHDIPPQGKVMTNAMEPLVQPDFTGRFAPPGLGRSIGHRGISGAITPRARPHAQAPTRAGNPRSQREIVLRPENKNRIERSGRGVVINLRARVIGRRPVAVRAVLGDGTQRFRTLHNSRLNSRRARGQPGRQIGKRPERGDGICPLSIAGEMVKAPPASPGQPHIQFGVNQQQSFPNRHGRTITQNLLEGHVLSCPNTWAPTARRPPRAYFTVTNVPTGISEKSLRAKSPGSRMQPCEAG